MCQNEEGKISWNIKKENWKKDVRKRRRKDQFKKDWNKIEWKIWIEKEVKSNWKKKEKSI